MAWRSLLRRVPTRSLTIVGDVAQTSTSAGTQDWARTFDPVLAGQWRLAELTVNYRTPAAVTEAAERVGHAAGLPLTPTTAARDVPDALTTRRVTPDAVVDAVVEAARAAVEQVRDASGAGRVAVIAVPGTLPTLAVALRDLPGMRPDPRRNGSPDLDAPLTLLTPTQSKGLEFDAVVLVEPAAVLRDGAGPRGGAGDLYVAMTRPTQALRVVHTEDLPAGWEA
jgi:DNA helicase IV